MRKNRVNKKFIYLISPNRIKDNLFYYDLEQVLKTRKVNYFQLRLKNQKRKKKIFFGKKIKKICKKYNVKFLVNDDPQLAKILNSDGCHLGQKDMSILKARKILKNKIIGITCHNSLKMAKEAIKNRANYIAIGAFNTTKTKYTRYKATIKDLKKIRNISKKPIVVIGGINQNNYKKLLLNKADFLAISSFIWKNKKLKPIEAIKEIK